MKQYNKVFLEGRTLKFDEYQDLDEIFSLKVESNVIVLTIEELQDLWYAAQDRARAMEIGCPGDTQIFERYLQDKGIVVK